VTGPVWLDGDQSPARMMTGQTGEVSTDAGSPDWAQLYAQLYKDHRDTMYYVALDLLGSSRSTDAMDSVHNAFASLMQNPPAVVENWEALLVSTTKRRVLDHFDLAETRKAQPAGDSFADDGYHSEAPPTDDVADQVIRRADATAVQSQLRNILATLRPQQRAVAERRILHSMSVGEIAVELSTSQANVSQLLRKALARIAEALENLDVHPADIDAVQPTRQRRGGS
jgi:RNA polymerase sigma factor (sigma-70 family)